MRKQNFKGYLKEYLIDVSGLNTLSVAKLYKNIKKNYRIRDALVLYSALTNKRDRLNKCSKGEYKDVLALIKQDNFLIEYQDYDFKKIYEDYQNKLKSKQNDDFFKSKLRSKIIKTMNEKKISKYRIYTDLKLNPGNVNAYLKNDNPNKVSSSLAKRIYRYVDSY